MKILYVYADVAGSDGGYCSSWLCAFPVTALERAGYDVDMVHATEFIADRPKADIIVVERLLWVGNEGFDLSEYPDGPRKNSLRYYTRMNTLDAITDAQENGSKVIAVLDDYYEAHPGGKFKFIRDMWLDGVSRGVDMGFKPIEDLKAVLGVVDAVMTPSKFLTFHYGQYAHKAYYVHNRPILDMFPTRPVDTVSGDKIVIGWSGTGQHVETWVDNPMIDALARLRKDIVVSGVIPDMVCDIIEHAGVEVRQIGPVEIEKFPHVVAGYDIGICPLWGEYDKGRSWIKWLECSLMGKPVVAQDLAGVYSECKGGYLASTPEEWHDALSTLVYDERARRGESLAGLSWSWRQGLEENLDELLGVFDEVRHG